MIDIPTKASPWLITAGIFVAAIAKDISLLFLPEGYQLQGFWFLVLILIGALLIGYGTYNLMNLERIEIGLKELSWKRMNKGLNINIKKVKASLGSYWDSETDPEPTYVINYKIVLNVGNPSSTVNIIMGAKVESKRFGEAKVYRFESRKIKERDKEEVVFEASHFFDKSESKPVLKADNNRVYKAIPDEIVVKIKDLDEKEVSIPHNVAYYDDPEEISFEFGELDKEIMRHKKYNVTQEKK